MPDAAGRSDVHVSDSFVGGRCVQARATHFFDVRNPAVGDVIGRTPRSSAADVDDAVQAAAAALPGWRDTPVNARAQVLHKFKAPPEQHFEELARLVTTEHGKALDESRGCVRRAVECVEVACGAPSLVPFNFPAMVPMWFLPVAIVTGNTFVLTPSEQVPLT